MSDERPALNTPLLSNTMTWIETYPETYEPRVWGVRLPTRRVIADFGGWAVMLDNPERRPPEGVPDGDDWKIEHHWTVDGEWMPTYAQRLLGVTLTQRWVLFHVGATVPGLRAVVDELVRSNGETEEPRLRALARAAGIVLGD